VPCAFSSLWTDLPIPFSPWSLPLQPGGTELLAEPLLRVALQQMTLLLPVEHPSVLAVKVLLTPLLGPYLAPI